MTYTDDEVGRLPIAEGRAELLEEIMSESTKRSTWVRWAAPLGAAAAVLLVVGGIALAQGTHRVKDDDGGFAGQAGAPVCWDGTPGPTCSAPAGAKALAWVFPRLAGHLDECVDALKAESDDPPMPFGTPGPGSSGSQDIKPAAYRCDLGKLGVDASPQAPRVWVYALGTSAKGTKPWQTYVPSLVDRYRTGTFTVGGERAGSIARTEVGLVHPTLQFVAKYDDYPFAVMAFADNQGEFEQTLAALGARRPSDMTKPAEAVPSMPDFPSRALQSPEPTPS